MTAMAGVLLEFRAGTVIFNEGDPGGDLFFIKEGEVEVYKSKGGLDVGLALLKSGEVLGIMTCLTREPRLASARAKTDVKALIVKKAGIYSLISSTPAWVNAVIKDFTLRVKNMDQLYWEAVAQRGRGGGALQTTCMMLQGLAEIGELIADGPVASVDRALDHVARILGTPKERLVEYLGILRSSGVIGYTEDGKGAPQRAEVAVLKRIATAFAEAAQRFQSNDSLSDADVNALLATSKLATDFGIKGNDEATLDLKVLAGEGVTIEALRQALSKAEALSLARVTEPGEQTTATFVPAQVQSQMFALRAIRALRAKERKGSAAPAIQAITESF